MLLGYNSAHTASTVAIASKSSSCAANAAFLTPIRSTFILAHTRRTRGRALRQRVWNTLSTLARSKTTPRVVSGSPLRKSPATPWSASHATNVPPVEIIMAELPPPRKATTAKTPDGDKRKEHAEELCSRIEEVVQLFFLTQPTARRVETCMLLQH